jgi:hypothetical protein
MLGRLEVRMQGLEALAAKLQAERLYRRDFRRGFAQIVRMGRDAGRAAAPVRTGATRRLLTSKVRGSPTPTLAVIHTTAVSPRPYRGRPFPYPRRQEYDARMGHQFWLRNAIQSVMGAMRSALEELAQRVEGSWRG